MGSLFRDLLAWQRAVDLVEGVYSATEDFPAQEAYGLASQMRRAAVSIPSNIAEGRGRGSQAEFRRFLCTARGSLMELETQLEFACRLKFLPVQKKDELLEQISTVARLINGLISAAEKAKGASAGGP